MKLLHINFHISFRLYNSFIFPRAKLKERRFDSNRAEKYHQFTIVLRSSITFVPVILFTRGFYNDEIPFCYFEKTPILKTFDCQERKESKEKFKPTVLLLSHLNIESCYIFIQISFPQSLGLQTKRLAAKRSKFNFYFNLNSVRQFLFSFTKINSSHHLS